LGVEDRWHKSGVFDSIGKRGRIRRERMASILRIRENIGQSPQHRCAEILFQREAKRKGKRTEKGLISGCY